MNKKYKFILMLLIVLFAISSYFFIKEIAENGYALPSTNVHSKDEKFQRIIGICDAVIMVLKEN